VSPFYSSDCDLRRDHVPLMDDTRKPRGFGITVPKLPSNRQDDYFEVKIQFSRKAVGFFITVLIILSRLIEDIGIDLLHSIL